MRFQRRKGEGFKLRKLQRIRTSPERTRLEARSARETRRDRRLANRT